MAPNLSLFLGRNEMNWGGDKNREVFRGVIEKGFFNKLS
jgi:hypothetical protein